MINEYLFIIHALVIAAISWWVAQKMPDALVGWIALQGVLANLLVLKQMDVFGLTVTCSDVYIIGSMLSLNLLQERFGRHAAQRAIAAGFLLMLLYLAMTQLHLWYMPSAYDGYQQHYRALFALMPRIVGASVATYLIVQLVDTYLYAWLRALLHDRFFTLRSAFSLVVSQVLDTALFTIIGLYGIVHAPWHIFGMSLLVKGIVIACVMPLIALLNHRK